MVQMGKFVDPKICLLAFDNIMSGEQLLGIQESTQGSGRVMEVYCSDPSSPNFQAKQYQYTGLDVLSTTGMKLNS